MPCSQQLRDALLAKQTPMHALVDLGCGFFVEAKSNAQTVIVKTGVPDLMVELTTPEALDYIAKREGLLREQVARLTDTANEIRAHIHTVRPRQFVEALEVIKNSSD